MHKKQSMIRYRIRSRNPAWKAHFFPWGLVGLLFILLPLLYAMFWYAKNHIQYTVQTEIQTELAAQKLDWVRVDVDGQAVTLSGQGSKREGDRAISLAKQVNDDAFWGRFSVPSKVDGKFTQAVELSVVEPVPTAEEPVEIAEAVAAKPLWGRLVGQLDAGVLTLTGTVGSQQEKDALLAAARNKLDPPRLTEVVDKMEVSQQSLVPASAMLAKRASELVAQCSSGQSSSADGVFSLECQTKRGLVKELQSLAMMPIDGAQLGNVMVSSSDDCNQEFAKMLEGKSIRFSIASANLKPSSAPLLDQVTELAKSCSGSIRVEGHTDKTGNFESNMALSGERAKAVVDALVNRGIKRERLSPEGFGSTKPRADGDTKVAYALNRRIEFHVSQ